MGRGRGPPGRRRRACLRPRYGGADPSPAQLARYLRTGSDPAAPFEVLDDALTEACLSRAPKRLVRAFLAAVEDG